MSGDELLYEEVITRMFPMLYSRSLGESMGFKVGSEAIIMPDWVSGDDLGRVGAFLILSIEGASRLKMSGRGRIISDSSVGMLFGENGICNSPTKFFALLAAVAVWERSDEGDRLNNIGNELVRNWPGGKLDIEKIARSRWQRRPMGGISLVEIENLFEVKFDQKKFLDLSGKICNLLTQQGWSLPDFEEMIKEGNDVEIGGEDCVIKINERVERLVRTTDLMRELF